MTSCMRGPVGQWPGFGNEIQEAIKRIELEGPDIAVYLELEPGTVSDLSLEAAAARR